MQQTAVHQGPKSKAGEETKAAIGTERRRATAAVSRLLTKLLTPAARQRGFAAVAVIEEWPAIVGPDLARRCHPVRLAFRPGSKEGGTLVLQAAGGAALELQHSTPQLLERVNDYFGFRAAARLQLLQMPLSRAVPEPTPPRTRPLTDAEEAGLAADVAGIGDSELGAALAALGRSIKGRQVAG